MTDFFQQAKLVGGEWENRPSKDVDLSLATAEAMRKNLGSEPAWDTTRRYVRADSPDAAVLLMKAGFNVLVQPSIWDETITALKAEGLWEDDLRRVVEQQRVL